RGRGHRLHRIRLLDQRGTGHLRGEGRREQGAVRALVFLFALLCGCRAAPQIGPIKLDGELDEEDWTRAVRSGAFVDAAGVEGRPYSEARFLWDDEALYVALYAGDDDIRATVTEHDGPVWLDDAFSLHLTPAAPGSPTYVIEISAGGVLTDGRRDANGKLDLG